MIIVKLTGGLGNQLFQYAYGRALAEKHGVPLKLDVNWYAGVKDRAYELGHFAISGERATAEEIAAVGELSLVAKAADALRPFARRRVIAERFFQFDPEALRVGRDVYVDGYWQSEKYFAAVVSIIRREFSFVDPVDEQNRAMSERIACASAPVSLHVRRGDYVANAATNQFHGTTTLEYYRAALASLATSVSKPTLFVFSDDHAWVRDNLKYEYETVYVDHNDPARGYEDLRLMSQCHHHIIANSSFSWWGAWLAGRREQGQRVIAPRRWFATDEKDTRDVLPEWWERA